MRKTILVLLILLMSLSSFSQTKYTLNKKVDKIFTYYKADKIGAMDSSLFIIKKDKWFTSLSSGSQKFRINRINYYRTICIKRPQNQVYAKGWVKRALN